MTTTIIMPMCAEIISQLPPRPLFLEGLWYYCSKVAISFLLSCRRISGLAEAGNDGNGTLRLAGNQLCPRPEATEIELLLDDTSTFSWGIHVNFARQKKGKEKISRILLFYPCTMGWNSSWGISHTCIHGRLWFLIFLPFGYWEERELAGNQLCPNQTFARRH